MHSLNYETEAVLYCSKNAKGKPKSLIFQRFEHASEAIRYAIEELSPHDLQSCSIEVDEVRFFGKEIRPLYESQDFPLPRRTVKTA